MNKISQLLLTLVFLGFSFCLQAEPAMDPNEAIVKQIMTSFMAKHDIPGVAVELYVNGVPHSYYYGYANREKESKVTKLTLFEVGSISKILTALLLAQEIDFAKMSLDDSITKYIPDLPKTFEEVNLQDLATHTSGLPLNAPNNVTTQAMLQDYLSKWSSKNADFNNSWQYSNIGIGLLGYALESSTHKDINKLYKRHILLPLGMQLIGTDVPANLKRFYAQGYDQRNNLVPASKIPLFPAAADIKASANDMQHFLSAAIGLPGTSYRILYPMRLTQTAFVQLPDRLQGLGWQIHPLTSHLPSEPAVMNLGPIKMNEIEKPLYNGDALIDKTGATNGFRAYIALLPNKKSGIVILTNKHIVSDGALANVGREILFKLTKT